MDINDQYFTEEELNYTKKAIEYEYFSTETDEVELSVVESEDFED